MTMAMTDLVPSPKNILRGHKAQIHAAVFIRCDERLATGDAEGFVVLWDLTIMRPRVVWRPHEGAILGIRGWGQDKVITHGRDHKLIVWQIGRDDERNLSAALPLDDAPAARPEPKRLHVLEVNTMNFCAFAACPSDVTSESTSIDGASDIHVAVPHTLASDAVDIFSLPSRRRIHTVRSSTDMGMAMSLALLNLNGCLTLIAAFENGFASVHRLQQSGDWMLTYRSQAHTQPVLSLDVHPDRDSFFTSSADAIVAQHPIPSAQQEVIPTMDPGNRVIEEVDDEDGSSAAQGPSSSETTLQPWEHPRRTVNTRHSGQQSLRVRSDGRIFATAGWDSKVRVYSCKTLKSLAVLQWHRDGCYAVAFSTVGASENEASGENVPDSTDGQLSQTATVSTRRRGTAVGERRIHQAQTTNWIAAGAKDGKISLWDIY